MSEDPTNHGPLPRPAHALGGTGFSQPNTRQKARKESEGQDSLSRGVQAQASALSGGQVELSAGLHGEYVNRSKGFPASAFAQAAEGDCLSKKTSLPARERSHSRKSPKDRRDTEAELEAHPAQAKISQSVLVKGAHDGDPEGMFTDQHWKKSAASVSVGSTGSGHLTEDQLQGTTGALDFNEKSEPKKKLQGPRSKVADSLILNPRSPSKRAHSRSPESSLDIATPGARLPQATALEGRSQRGQDPLAVEGPDRHLFQKESRMNSKKFRDVQRRQLLLLRQLARDPEQSHNELTSTMPELAVLSSGITVPGALPEADQGKRRAVLGGLQPSHPSENPAGLSRTQTTKLRPSDNCLGAKNQRAENQPVLHRTHADQPIADQARVPLLRQMTDKETHSDAQQLYLGLMRQTREAVRKHKVNSHQLKVEAGQSLLVKRKKLNQADDLLDTASSRPNQIDLNERFGLQKSKTSGPNGRPFLQPSLLQKVDAQYLQQSQLFNTGGAPVVEPKKAANYHHHKAGPPKEVFHASFGDFNYNLCKDDKEEFQSSMKVFNSYLQFCTLAYWGPQGGPQAPRMGQEQDESQAPKGNTVLSGLISQTQKQQKEKSRYQMTAYDILYNPLRAEHPFEDWSPKEITRFQACLLMYGKNFSHFLPHLEKKSLSEIQEFYRCWKQTPYYREWKQKNHAQKEKKDQKTLTDQVFPA